MVKVIFMGTPEISVSVLETLSKLQNTQIVAVVSQPDKAIDRKKQIVYSPVKKFCLANDIKLLQPQKVNDIYQELSTLAPDIIITCAYGQFIPQKILDLPKLGCYNLHASLLPSLRGGAPIHWSIINGNKQTGVTLMKMILKMDAGDMIASKKCLILPTETTRSLTAKLCELAQQVLIENWENLINQTYQAVAQDESQATFGYNISKKDSIINFNKTCHQIDCLIRGLYDKPIALWIYQDIQIKVHNALTTTSKSVCQPGTITKIDKTGIYVATSDFDLQITHLQMPGKTCLNVAQIINGNHNFKVGNK